jgi:hypothetical protein
MELYGLSLRNLVKLLSMGRRDANKGLGKVGKNSWFVYTFCYNDLWEVKV